MAAYICSVRVHLPRPLFRKLMAQAILERTDLSSLVVRAIRAETAPERLGRSPLPRTPKRSPGNA
jgi:hypothetical protein